MEIKPLRRFARNVGRRLLEIVKDYLVSRLIGFIRTRTRAYPLVTVILGRDPISDEPVERTPMSLLRASMRLSEAGEEKLRQMEETGTLARAAAWIDGAIARVTRNLRSIRNGFLRIWRTASIQNLMDPVGTFQDIYGFMPFTLEEMDDFANRYLLIMDPRLIKVVINEQGKPWHSLSPCPISAKGSRSPGDICSPSDLYTS